MTTMKSHIETQLNTSRIDEELRLRLHALLLKTHDLLELLTRLSESDKGSRELQQLREQCSRQEGRLQAIVERRQNRLQIL